MRLIKKKLKGNAWWKKWKEKVQNGVKHGGVTLAKAAAATGISLSILFGAAACASTEAMDNKVESAESKVENAEQNETLLEILAALKTVASNLGVSDEYKDRFAEIEQMIKANYDSDETQNETIAQILEVLNLLKSDLNSLNDRVAALESKETDSETIEETTVEETTIEETQPETETEHETEKTETEQPDNDKEAIDDIKTKLAKCEAKLAIEFAFSNNYMQCEYEDVEMQSAPNGDITAERNRYNDYMYFDKEKGVAYVSNEGEESFSYLTDDQQLESFDFKTFCLEPFEDTSLKLEVEESSENQFVFKNADGNILIITLENGALKSFGDDDIQITQSTQEKFESLLVECKSALKSIGLLENYEKSLNESLTFKYAEVLATNEAGGKIENGSGVFSGREGATKTTNENKDIYSMFTSEGYYSCALDDAGNKIGEESNETAYDYDIAQSFKDMCSPTRGELYYGISLDDETGKYTLTSYGDDDTINMKIEIGFNDDSSVDAKISDGEIVFTYHIKEISLERYNEVFAKIKGICEQAKSQDTGLTQ